MRNKKKITYTIEIEEDIIRAIEDYAQQEKISISEAVNDCLHEYYGSVDEATSTDPFLDQITKEIFNFDTVSAVFLQRKYELGFRRACRIINQLEKQGYITKEEGMKPRRVIKSN